MLCYSYIYDVICINYILLRVSTPTPPPLMGKILGVHVCVCVLLYSLYFARATHSVDTQAA